MARVCVISVAGLSGRMVELAPAGGTLRRLGEASRLVIRPVLPAVTCTMQATVTTGVPPGRHGIIANGLYLAELGKVSFWEQSNRLLDAPRFWQRSGNGRQPGASRQAADKPPRGPAKTAMLFWQNSMFGAADVVVTPRPVHTPDGRTISACYSDPPGLYAELAGRLGPFELKHYWGPLAGLPASRWIAEAAVHVWQAHRPDLELVYLPHLDYGLQRLGPEDERIVGEVAAVDALLGRILQAVQSDSGTAVVMGDYGIVPVRRAVLPNVALRQAGLLRVRTLDGAEFVEVGEQQAFAMVDHQVAHVYCPGESARRRAKEALMSVDGIAEVIDLTEADSFNLRHRRGGQLVALAEPDAWFAYGWWLDESAAPPFARTVDIHAKPGYDPCELFFDPAKRAIPLDTSLVKGSHGLVRQDHRDMPALLCSAGLSSDSPVVDAAEVAGLLQSLMG